MEPSRLIKATLKHTKDCLSRCFPERCPMCHSRSDSGFCIACYKYLPGISLACSICATPCATSLVCGRCQTRPPAQDDSIVALSYQDPINRYIQDLKYNRQLHLARPLSLLLCQAIETSFTKLPVALVPIPLHPRRLRTRGFNHSHQIARILAHYFNIPLKASLLKRSKNTAPQTSLDEAQRRRNLKAAFTAQHQSLHHYSHIALIDDVITSGNTMAAAARTLKSAGVGHVSAWALAKTVI